MIVFIFFIIGIVLVSINPEYSGKNAVKTIVKTHGSLNDIPNPSVTVCDEKDENAPTLSDKIVSFFKDECEEDDQNCNQGLLDKVKGMNKSIHMQSKKVFDPSIHCPEAGSNEYAFHMMLNDVMKNGFNYTEGSIQDLSMLYRLDMPINPYEFPVWEYCQKWSRKS